MGDSGGYSLDTKVPMGIDSRRAWTSAMSLSIPEAVHIKRK